MALAVLTSSLDYAVEPLHYIRDNPCRYVKIGNASKPPRERIILTKEQFEIFGKNEDTISFMINEIKYIQFKCKEGNQLYDWLQNAWDENDSVVFNIVGKPSINEYNGVRTPQIIIEDVVVVSTNNSDDDEEW